MKHSVLILSFSMLILSSCSKNYQPANEPNTLSDQLTDVGYFIKSIDNLSPAARNVAIANFTSSYNNKTPQKKTDQKRMAVTTDDWNQYAMEKDWVEADEGDEIPNQTGNRREWVVVKNQWGFWKLMSRIDLLRDSIVIPGQATRFISAQHYNSGLEGLTAFLSWEESTCLAQLSSSGYVASDECAGHIKGTFTGGFPEVVAFISRIKFFVAD